MKSYPLVFTLLLTFLLFSCGTDTKLKAVQDSLAIKNRHIDSLNIQLKLKDDTIAFIKNSLDTTKITEDSAAVYKAELVGRWAVNMQCIETSCEGSAIGDVKNEQWEISYEGAVLVAKAFNNKEVTRIYKGAFSNEHIELKSIEPTGNTQMIVTLQQRKDEGTLEGVREIIKANDCRIRYSIKLAKL
ncbi:hypothetical protein [Desertivirga brevis]|uniref:hypothetical protein n=1 Tax=Desertivirga brevis TaxID=2810310 RepID=UPI001A957237|nr:hypothetical protein [Pedobacter sp. SYSU D00873]